MASNLFAWLDSLWTKTKLSGTAPTYMMHRFLAGNKHYAIAARYLQMDLRREPALIVGTWQALLPKGAGAPRLPYVAPKKPKAAEALTERMVKVLGEPRHVVEEMQEIIDLAGGTDALYIHFGVEPPAPAKVEAAKPTGGLLDNI
ncbi:hypothetical protein LCGC14_0446700 [marine sediment metagenome]|uniref:Uncharacterized protein n=1 Tax=marine sediment metagenome TaxID=412755 RepID=A0A0F9SPK6_9ZZZZ